MTAVPHGLTLVLSGSHSAFVLDDPRALQDSYREPKTRNPPADETANGRPSIP